MFDVHWNDQFGKKFSFFSEPIALGTILFASTFLCTDILAEYYGINKAKKNVVIGFMGFLLMTVISLFTLGFKPLAEELAIGDYAWVLNNEKRVVFLQSLSKYLPKNKKIGETINDIFILNIKALENIKNINLLPIHVSSKIKYN